MSGYSHEVRSIGGYFSARITISASKKKVEDWIDYGLGRHIVVYSPSLVVIWEGFVNSIKASLGPLEFTIGPLLDIKNRVAVTYSTVDTSVTPPAIGARVTTSTANNTTSQARYGIIGANHSTDGDTATGAAQLRDMLVNDPNRAYPPTSRDSNLSGGGASVELECAGYWHWLNVYNYANTAGAGDVNLSTKIQSVLAANPNGLFSTDYSMITTNTTQRPAYEDGNRTAEAILKDLNSKGDSSFNSYTMGFYAGRRFYYQPAPAEIAYQQRITGNRGIVNKLDLVTRPWDVLGARWIFYPDFLIGRFPPITGANLGTDPRAGFIETVGFRAPYEVSVNGVKLNTLDQVLARRGLGSIA